MVSVSFGLPMVSVPVLSTISVSTPAMRSSASASLISTPACAPRPAAVVIEIGVASPSAQGQAMINTDTADAMAKTSAGSGPKISQTAKATMAMATTVGTKTADTRSARPWIGARDRRAFDTIATIWASTVSDPTLPALDHQGAVLIDRGAGDRIARTFFHWHRLTSQHALVQRRATFDHRPVDRDSIARAHAKPIALHDVLQRRVVFGAVRQDAPRRLGRQIQKCADRVTGAFSRPQFQNLAYENQRHDNHRCLEVGADAVAHPVLLGKDSGQERRDDRIEIGRPHAEADQRPHVRRSVHHRVPAAPKKMARRPKG